MATDATLTKTQKNAVLAQIQQFQLDPPDFDLGEILSVEGYSSHEYEASQLVHRGTGYYLTFGGIYMTYSPGVKSKTESKPHNDHWPTKQTVLARWLQMLRAEVEAPDLWAAVGKERELSDAASSHLANKPFTTAEQAEIGPKLEELKHYLLLGQQIQAEQARFVEEQFQYLRESSQRLGRKDWLSIVWGNLISLALNLALPPERANGLLHLAGSLLQSLWHGAQALLQ